MKQSNNDITLPQQLFTAYAEFYRPMVSTVNRILAPYRIHSAQWSVLKRLHHTEPQTAVSLARQHGVETPSMTDNLKKLMMFGYIKVERGEDAREKKLYLTQKGHATYDQLSPLFESLYRNLTDSITQEELETCTKIFQVFRNKLQETKNTEGLP